MILSSTQKLQVVLGAAPTNQLPLVAGWADMLDDASTLAPASTTSITTGITAVDLVASPAAGSKRQIKYLSAYNADTAAATLTVQIVDGANTRVLGKVTLAVGARLEYTGEGFRAFDSSGALAGSGGGGGFTNPMTTAGDLIVGGAAGAPTRLAAGATAGHVLTSNGSGVAASYQALPASGGGGITWSTVAANTTMANDNAYNVNGAFTMTLPASVATGKQFIVHAMNAAVTVASNGNVIALVGSGNDLTLASGETAWLVGSSTGNLEIV